MWLRAAVCELHAVGPQLPTMTAMTIRPLSLPAVVPVAGVSFHQDVVSTLRVGDVLRVLPEPENPYDAEACVVLAGTETVGHISRALAPRLRLTGNAWTAEVVELLPGNMAVGVRVRLRPLPVTDATAESTHVARPERSSDGDAPVPLRHPVLREVRAKSGRRLGRYLGRADGQVLVGTDDDRTVRFPESLVICD
jgi:hypothetical protein